MQHVDVLELLLVAARPCSIGRWVVCAVHHVVLRIVVISVQVEALQLIGSFSGRGLEVLEEVDEGSYAPLTEAQAVFATLYTNLPAPRS